MKRTGFSCIWRHAHVRTKLSSKLLQIIGKVYLSLFDFLPHSKSLTNSTGTCFESVTEVILRARLSTGLP